jgi:ubiquinone/menaquinone biosynthesis C-methylase UbiE
MNPTERFSTRVENYVKYRPHYPSAVVELLQSECGLNRDSIVADVGSGSGILSELFLQHGCSVIGIEPNREMREAGEKLLRHYPNFKSVAGAAESTRLENQSVDFITAGQAFHWFNREKAHEEFKRILKPHGWVVLIWNDRKVDSTPFLKSYEELLLTHGTDYQQVNHRQIEDQNLERFYAPNPLRKAIFKNEQQFDFEGVKGRLLSSSYVPESGTRLDEMLKALREIYEANERGGEVVIEYDTLVYFGNLDQ